MTVARLHHLKATPVVALLGPHQCGKTTLARQVATDHPAHYFDLEDPADAASLANPREALSTVFRVVNRT